MDVYNALVFLIEDLPVIIRHMSTEPSCKIFFLWELPIPVWDLALITIGAIYDRTIKTQKELAWLLVRFLIVLRLELLMLVLLIPLLISRYRSWLKDTDYQFGVAVLVLRVAFIALALSAQLPHVDDKCVRTGYVALTKAKNRAFDQMFLKM